MDLNNRLRSIVNMLEKTNTVVDVGTDHGYIPIYLVANNICKKVIATDISKASLDKAKKNIKFENLSDYIELRKGNGFSVLSKDEANIAIVSGMGGNLIRDILLDSIQIVKELDFLILQPVQNPEVLREFLVKYGFIILDEDLCIDEGKYYEIIKVKFGNIEVTDYDTFYEISPILLARKHPILKAYIKHKINNYEKILVSINSNTESSILRITEVQVKIKKLKELLSCLF